MVQWLNVFASTHSSALHNMSRLHARRAVSPSLRLSRHMSAVSQHRVFPATLFRLNHGLKSNLYDFNHQKVLDGQRSADAIRVSPDDLVRPGVSLEFPFSNGALLMPNTFMMQELIRTAVDEYYEDAAQGKSTLPLYIHTIRKGTPAPTLLTLFREHTSRFSLQPITGMSLSDLNASLTKFYTEHGEVHPAEAWLDDHEFEFAQADDAEEEWMAH